jgi:hypothetical protein
LIGAVKVIHQYLPRELGERGLQSIIGGQYKDGLDEDHKVEWKAVRLFCGDGSGREWTVVEYKECEGDDMADLRGGHGWHVAGWCTREACSKRTVRLPIVVNSSV